MTVAASLPWDSGKLTLAEVEALLERPAWHADALCKEHPELSWFPGRGEPTDAARSICAGCAVQTECLGWARDLGDATLSGVWGGIDRRPVFDRLPRRTLRIHVTVTPPPKPRANARKPRPKPVPVVCSCGRRLATEGRWRAHVRGMADVDPDQVHQLVGSGMPIRVGIPSTVVTQT